MNFSPELIGSLGIVVLILLTFLRIPIGVAMGVVGICGYASISGWTSALYVAGSTPYDLAHYTLSVLPLFILMGTVATAAGMSKELFAATNAIFAGRRGALAMATIGACGAFGAICGSSVATAATFTSIAVPQMRDYKYDDRLATGAVAAGGTLGILIPPSVMLVLYGLVAEQPIPQLFAGSLIPGIILTGLFVVAVWTVMRIRPDFAAPSPPMAMRDRLRTAPVMWKVIVLFGLAVVGIYAGWFSPTEAAGIAAFAAIIIGWATRKLRFEALKDSIQETLLTTGMLFYIIVGAWIFAYFIDQSRLPSALIEAIVYFNLSGWQVLLSIIIFYIILGCFLDAVAIVLITVPLFLPLIIELGYDPIWFGVLVVVVIEVGMITPPVGLNIFVIRAQLPEIKLTTIYAGIVPFLAANAVLISLLVLFPALVLWLPELLF